MVFLIPNPMTEREEKTPIRYRKVIPSFEPDNEEPPQSSTQPPPDDATYQVRVFQKLNKCYKLRSYIENEKASIIFYLAAPGEYRTHQRVRTLFESFMRRRDQYVIFIDCNIPSLQDLKVDNNRTRMLVCAENISVCHNQLDKFNNRYETHFIGMGVSAHILSTAAVYNRIKPDRLTALDAMRRMDLFKINFNHLLRLEPLNSKSAKVVVAFHSNMGRHGLSKPIKGAVNIIINNGNYQPGCTSKRRRPVEEHYVDGFSPRIYYHNADEYCNHEFSSAFFAYNIRFSCGGIKARLCRAFRIFQEECQYFSAYTYIKVGLLNQGAYLSTERGDYYLTTTDQFEFYPEHYMESQNESQASHSSTSLTSQSYSDSPEI